MFSKKLFFGILAVLMICITINTPTPKAFAYSGLVITNNGKTLPANTLSDGSISVCIGNSPFYNIPPNDNQFKFSVDIEPGNYNYRITSLVKSSLDGSLINPCTVDSEFILLTGSVDIKDGTAYEFTFSGSPKIVDPRTLAEFKNQTPYVLSRTGSYVFGPGLYISYPDSFVDSNGNEVNGPLSTTKSICLDNGAAGPVLIKATEDTGSSLYFDILPVGYIVYPPFIDGTCNTNLDVFTDNTKGIFPSVKLPTDPTLTTTFISFEGIKITGFNATLTEFRKPITSTPEPTPTPVVPASPATTTTPVAITTQTTTKTPTAVKTTTKTTPATKVVAPKKTTPVTVRTGGNDLGLGLSMIVGGFLLLMFSSATFGNQDKEQKPKRLKTSTNIA